jgi:hypothetical protein
MMNSLAFLDSAENSTPRAFARDADLEAVHRRPPGDQAGAVQRLVLTEPRAVHYPGQHLARVEWNPEVDGSDAEQLVGVVKRLVRGSGGRRAELGPVQVSDDLAADPDAVALVRGEIIGQPRDPRVHGRATEFLVIGILAGGHFHQRRTTRKTLAWPSTRTA